MIKLVPTIDRTDLPKEPQKWLYDYVQKNDIVSGNNTYFKLYLNEFRQYIAENALDEYVQDYGQDLALFMEWLNPKTNADEVLILYWW